MRTGILMTTVAALALTLPAVAQNQDQPEATGQQVEELQKTQPEQTTEGTAAGQTTAEQPAAPAAEGQQPPSIAEDRPEEPAEQEVAEDEAPPAEMKFIEVQQDAQFLANDEVIGKPVVNAMDEEVGEIADLVMDRDQKLVGVVLSVGGFLGIGEKWVAVPVETIEFPADDQPARLLVEVSKEQLENAPDFVTRDTIEAQEAAERAQQQMQQPQTPPPATATQ